MAFRASIEGNLPPVGRPAPVFRIRAGKRWDLDGAGTLLVAHPQLTAPEAIGFEDQSVAIRRELGVPVVTSRSDQFGRCTSGSRRAWYGNSPDVCIFEHLHVGEAAPLSGNGWEAAILPSDLESLHFAALR